MAAKSFAVDGGAAETQNGKITTTLAITCIIAASTGLIFGYDMGVSGGVTTMVPFLEEFFPSVLKRAANAKTNAFCVYDDQLLTLFNSSINIANFGAALAGCRLTALVGRRNIILLGGCVFLAGAALNGGAINIPMLIFGRILLGIGVGFTIMAAPVYISELAPPKRRGMFMSAYLYFNGIGSISASCINIFMAKPKWGWRVALGFSAIPATIMTLGALAISDTPSSLVERGKVDEARETLYKIRGQNNDVDAELSDLIKCSEIAKATHQEAFLAILKRQYRPQLVMSIALPFFIQVTGINMIGFYAPIFFQSVGFGNESALIATVVLGIVNLCATAISTLLVDRYGRRLLFIVGGIQMLFCQVVVASLLLATTGVSGTKTMSKGYATTILVLICLFCVGFQMSWGSLVTLVMSEIFPTRIRSSGQAVGISVMSISSFVLAQIFLTMLCHLKFATFLFYAGWLVVMTIFVVLFLPETKGIPLDAMHQVWERHWYWRRFGLAQQL